MTDVTEAFCNNERRNIAELLYGCQHRTEQLPVLRVRQWQGQGLVEIHPAQFGVLGTLELRLAGPLSDYEHVISRISVLRGPWLAQDRQLISDQWIDWARTPTPAQPTYGFMNFFLNTDKKFLPSAPATAFTHIGNGTNMIYVDPEHDVVAVARWIDGKAMDGFVKRLLAAIDAKS